MALLVGAFLYVTITGVYKLEQAANDYARKLIELQGGLSPQPPTPN